MEFADSAGSSLSLAKQPLDSVAVASEGGRMPRAGGECHPLGRSRETRASPQNYAVLRPRQQLPNLSRYPRSYGLGGFVGGLQPPLARCQPADRRRCKDERLEHFYSVGIVFRLASFSSIAERMNLKYVRSIMRRLVPVCAATVSGSTP